MFFWGGLTVVCQPAEGGGANVLGSQSNAATQSNLQKSHSLHLFEISAAEAGGAEPRRSDIRSDIFQATSGLQGSVLLLDRPSDSSEPGLILNTSQGKRQSSSVLKVCVLASPPRQMASTQQRDNHHCQEVVMRARCLSCVCLISSRLASPADVSEFGACQPYWNGAVSVVAFSRLPCW